MISFDEALSLVLAEAAPLGSERVVLDEALGRRLAAPIVAALDAPRTNVSAMDGYAVREAELGSPLRVIGESFPGAGFRGEVPAGCCVRIFTGAPVPPECDRVVIQEIVARDGDMATLVGEVGGTRFIRRRGVDFGAGDELVPAGRVVDARTLVAAAGADCGEVTVWRRPSITILATGDELAEAGAAARIDGAIPDSASHGVAALALATGAKARRIRLPDDLDAIADAAAAQSLTSDVIVVIGGASVGEKDFAKAAFDKLGLELIFSRVAIRPGKPIWFGRLSDTLVLGLPGNPTSAMVTARLFLQPLLAALARGDPASEARWRRETLRAALPACDERETFARARTTADGIFPLGNQDSSAQKTLADADLLIRRRPGAPALGTGDTVDVIDF